MKVLFIGGSGIISSAAAELALQSGIELCLFNRGNHPERVPAGATVIQGDVNRDQLSTLADQHFDAVVDFIAYKPAQVQRDVDAFLGKCGQYLVISSACVYHKPLTIFPITESAPIYDSPWDYAQDKINCEAAIKKAYLEKRFPITIIRPTHTYSNILLPVGLCGKSGGWSVASRMLRGKPVLLHGDGLTLWTITHSRDVAKGIVGLLGNSRAIGEAVHITSDEAVSWDDLYHNLAYALGVEAKICHVSTDMLTRFFPDERGHLMGDTAHCAIFDNTKIKRLVPEFQATTTASRGIMDAVHYHLAHPELMKEDPEYDRVCDAVLQACEAFGK